MASNDDTLSAALTDPLNEDGVLLDGGNGSDSIDGGMGDVV
ncbi:MAG: hypothetical protein V3U74_04690 [Thermodesulfobacteriota bacterium]